MKPRYMSAVTRDRQQQVTMRRLIVERVAIRDNLSIRDRLALIDALRDQARRAEQSQPSTATERFRRAAWL